MSAFATGIREFNLSSWLQDSARGSPGGKDCRTRVERTPQPTPEPVSQRPPPPQRDRLAELALAGAVVILGIIVLWETRGIRVTPAYSRVGPRVIPYLVGAGLVVVGLWLAAEVLAGQTATGAGDAEDADPTLPTDWRCVAGITAALLIYLILLERAGFVIASALLFFGAAFGMGSRRVVRDAAAGILLAIAIYVIFTRGLGLQLPAGVLDGLL